MKIKMLRLIFLQYWDPILIQDNELLHDEYDDYAYRMLSYLKRGNINKLDIINLLLSFEDEMGVRTDISIKENVANMIIKYHTESAT